MGNHDDLILIGIAAVLINQGAHLLTWAPLLAFGILDAGQRFFR